MIPVVQTKVVVKNNNGDIVVRGNCLAAAVASILELPIQEVPNVEVLFHIDEPIWFMVMESFLESLGYEWHYDNNFSVFHDENYGESEDHRNKLIEEYKDRYYFASGKSPRGVNHIVIYKNGVMVHDPHPSKDGLLSIDVFEEIRKK